MTRKNFNAIAAAINQVATSARELRDMPNQSKGSAAQGAARFFGIQYAAEAIANVCAESNPRFDRNRFLTACGVSGANVVSGNGGDK